MCWQMGSEESATKRACWTSHAASWGVVRGKKGGERLGQCFRSARLRQCPRPRREMVAVMTENVWSAG